MTKPNNSPKDNNATKTTFNLRVNEQLKKEFNAKCRNNGESPTDVIERTMQAYINDNLTKEQKLSKKRIWLSTLLAILSIFIIGLPIGCYIYTERWIPLLTFIMGTLIGGGILMTIFKSLDLSIEVIVVSVYTILLLITITDNWIAISRARKKN